MPTRQEKLDGIVLAYPDLPGRVKAELVIEGPGTPLGRAKIDDPSIDLKLSTIELIFDQLDNSHLDDLYNTFIELTT